MSFTNTRNEQEKEFQRLCQTLPDGLPPVSPELVELTFNYKKLQELRQKCQQTTNPSDKARLQDSEKKYVNMTMMNYKQNFTELDKIHTKAIVQLKLLLQKVDKLEKFRNACFSTTNG